jgi:hypothetical protein
MKLANGWTLARKRVSGEWRIELAGASRLHTRQLLEMGFKCETINYNPHIFLPVGNIDLMSRLMELHPIIDGAASTVTGAA